MLINRVGGLCTIKYSPEVFVWTERRRSGQGLCKKKNTLGKYFPYGPSKREVNKTFIIWLLVHSVLRHHLVLGLR